MKKNLDVIYFDHNATSVPSKVTKEALAEYSNVPLNPSSIHSYGRLARDLVENARNFILASLNLSKDQYNFVFTSGATESNNTLFKSFRNNFYISAIEHDSIFKLLPEGQASNIIKVDCNGLIDLQDLDNKIKDSPPGSLVSIIYANNETGVVQNFDEIIPIVKKYGHKIHTDAVQAYGRIPLDLSNFDFVTIASHKSGGPVGVSCLIYKKDNILPPLMFGGKQEHGKRPGTENVRSIYAFGEFAKNINHNISEYKNVEKLRDSLEESINDISCRVKIVSRDVERLPNTSLICMPGVNSELQLINFDLAGIMLSSGSACSSSVVKESRVVLSIINDKEIAANSLRVSLAPSNNEEEIDIFVNKWRELYMRNLNKMETK